MLVHIVLSDADQERLGVTGPLEYDHGTMMVSEATALYKAAGLTRQALLAAIRDGDPEGKRAITWLALRRAGHQVRYSELDFDVVGWRLANPNPNPEPESDGDDEGNSGALPSEGQTPQA